MTDKRKKISPKTMGIIFIIISAFSFACMSLFVNMSGDMPVFQKAFFRNCVAIILSLGMLIRSKDKFKVKKGSLKYLILRASFGTLGILFNFYAISHINLADAQILNKLSPFFAILASIIILKEVANKRQWFCVIVAFIGALFVVKPAGLSDSSHLIPAIIGVMGGLVAGIAYTFMRKLSLKGERSEVIVAFFSIFSCLVLIPFVISRVSHHHPLNDRLGRRFALRERGQACAYQQNQGNHAAEGAFSHSHPRRYLCLLGPDIHNLGICKVSGKRDIDIRLFIRHLCRYPRIPLRRSDA